MLLRRTLADAGLATYRAKDHYKRARPFMAVDPATDAPICTPKDVAGLRKDGSYPSGHSAVGWAWGLVLSEVAPERTNALVQRGRAFGQSQVACGVHWQSDIDAGRLVAAAVLAQLHVLGRQCRRQYREGLVAGVLMVVPCLAYASWAVWKSFTEFMSRRPELPRTDT